MEQEIGPTQELPFSGAFGDTEEYVDSLLEFVWTSDLLRTLCGGVHILDFFTNSPDLYSTILPLDWREFFADHDVMDILDLLMREDLPQVHEQSMWRSSTLPPESLIEYIQTVRKHLLSRAPSGSQCSRNRAVKPAQKLARHVAVGMNVKKVHEVGLFASYIDTLSTAVADASGKRISHLVDFGSGQNYLGRALASEPYNNNIVAIESKQANAERAKEYDVMAKLTIKEKLMINKKAFRSGLVSSRKQVAPVDPAALPISLSDVDARDSNEQPAPDTEVPKTGNGKIQYVEHRIDDGRLRHVVDRIPTESEKALMVISLHSCGNLVHHGLRSLILNPEVKVVAMVGCCYNLMTERLGPTTYKLPELRPRDNPRLLKAGEARDPHGFPMSTRFMTYGQEKADPEMTGIRFNITSRMMAVQAPSNWGEEDSNAFFTRHFYRALLQRLFLDRGVVEPPTSECVGGRTPVGQDSSGTPIIIGSLRKACYLNFVTYVRGALSKIFKDPERGQFFQDKLADITDASIAKYEEDYKDRKRELSVIWSLMAFSASVVEATIVVDRWSYLKEQNEVTRAWVEPVFDYRLSPRNLVVVGIKG